MRHVLRGEVGVGACLVSVGSRLEEDQPWTDALVKAVVAMDGRPVKSYAVPLCGQLGRQLERETTLVYFAELCERGRVRGLAIHLLLESFVAPRVGKQPMRSRDDVVRCRFGATIRERRKVIRDNAKLEMCISMIQTAAPTMCQCVGSDRVAQNHCGQPCGTNLM